MHCCNCCVIGAGHSIVLEIIVIVFAKFYLIINIIRGNCNWMIPFDVGLVVSCCVGINALRDLKHFRWGFAASALAITVLAAYVTSLTFFVIYPSQIKELIQNIHDGRERDNNILVAVAVFTSTFALKISFALALAIRHMIIANRTGQNLYRKGLIFAVEHECPPITTDCLKAAMNNNIGAFSPSENDKTALVSSVEDC